MIKMLEVAGNLKLILWRQIIFSSINSSQKYIRLHRTTIASLTPDSLLNIKHDKCSLISEQMSPVLFSESKTLVNQSEWLLK